MMSARAVKSGDDLNTPSFLEQGKERPKSKSKFLALGLSLLLPGAGQYYTENKTRMIIFGSAEFAIWSAFSGFRLYGGWKKGDYKSWAVYHAGADVNGKPDMFYEKLTYYDNLDEYNQLARVYDGDRAQLFPDGPNSGYYWNWDSEASQSHYRNLRNQSKTAFRRSLYVLGGAVINRVLSGIDAFRSAGSYDHEQEFGQAGWHLYYSAADFIGDGEIEFGLQRTF